MIPFIAPLLAAGVPRLIDELDSLAGWASVVVSTNDDGNSGSVGVSTSNPFSGTGSASLITAPLGAGGEGDYGRTALAKTFSNPGYTRLRVAVAQSGTPAAPVVSGATATFISDTTTPTTSPSGTSPAVWHQLLYSISAADPSITVTLYPSSMTGAVYYDKLELF